MELKKNHLAWSLVAGMAATAAVGTATWGADHLDPSPRVGSPVGNPADIADLYAWHTADENLVVALTFAGPVAGAEFGADRDVLYAIHIDNNDASFGSDVDMYFRFGRDSAGNWGVMAENIPGTSGAIVGRVGSIIDLAGAKMYTGAREDPFFFDLQGFQDTLSTGDLAFQSGRDFFAGQNVSSIVIEIPLRSLPGDGPYQIWATSSRI